MRRTASLYAAGRDAQGRPPYPQVVSAVVPCVPDVG